MMEFRILDYNYLFQDDVGLTASSEDPEFPVSNLRRAHRSKLWRSEDGVTTANVVIDIGTTEAIDSVAFFFDPMRDIPLTDTATITVQASATNVWTAPPVSQVITVDFDLKAGSYFWTTNQSYRYWRIVVRDDDNPDARVELSKVVLGKATQPARLPGLQFGYSVEDLSDVQKSPYGQEYVDLYPAYRQLQFDFKSMPYSDLLLWEDIYRRVGKSIPIVIALDPLQDTYDREQFLIYGKLTSAISAKQNSLGFFDQSISIRETF